MRERIFAVAVLVLVVVYSTIPGNCYVMSATIDKEKIHVKISSVVDHNFTQLTQQDLSFSGEDLSKASAVIENAIKARQNSAAVKNLLLSGSLSSSSIKLDAEFDISGVVLVEGAILKANSTWRSFEVSENMSSRSVLWNRVGEQYFVPRVDYFVNITSTRFYYNQTTLVTSGQAKNVLKDLKMLDFRPLSLRLSAWNQTRSLAENKTRWTVKLGKVLDFSARQDLESSSVKFVISKSIDAEISVPGYGTLQGETIRTDVGTGETELTMLAIVLIATIGAICTHLIVRRNRRS